MKVVILTVHKAINFGAALQMYALYKTVDGLNPGGTTEILDYRAECREYRDNIVKYIFHANSGQTLIRRCFEFLDKCWSIPNLVKKKKI